MEDKENPCQVRILKNLDQPMTNDPTTACPDIRGNFKNNPITFEKFGSNMFDFRLMVLVVKMSRKIKLYLLLSDWCIMLL